MQKMKSKRALFRPAIELALTRAERLWKYGSIEEAQENNGGRGPMNNNRAFWDRDWLYLSTVWTTVVIAGLGFIFSFITLRQVAASFGMAPIQAFIFPLLLDLFMVVSHSAYFYLSKHSSDKWLVTGIMYLTVLLSVMFNLQHVWGQNFWVMLAWGLPPVILLLSVKVITRMVESQQSITELSPNYQETEKPVIVQRSNTIEQTERSIEQPPNGLNKAELARWAIVHRPELSQAEIARKFDIAKSTVSTANRELNNGNQT